MMKRFVLARRPDGVPRPDDFRLESGDIPRAPDGGIVIATTHVSVDPGMRSRLSGDSYAAALSLGETIESAGIGRVIESRNPKFAEGDLVSGALGWTTHLAHPGKGLLRLDPAFYSGAVSPTCAIGVLGVPGLTAWFGVHALSDLKAGEVFLVSSAAGPVGATAGQLAKAKGARVIGMAGSDAKCAWLIDELGFDAVINHRATPDLGQSLSAAAPEGVDVCFDNVGAEMLDQAIRVMRPNGRIVISGQVAEYNAASPRGIRHVPDFISKRLTMRGFVVLDYAAQFREAQAAMAAMIRDGTLKFREQMVEGFENLPQAFIGLFSGDNFGRCLVRVG